MSEWSKIVDCQIPIADLSRGKVNWKSAIDNWQSPAYGIDFTLLQWCSNSAIVTITLPLPVTNDLLFASLVTFGCEEE
jgi:hypothetical protein